jgi:hypothetical protein
MLKNTPPPPGGIIHQLMSFFGEKYERKEDKKEETVKEKGEKTGDKCKIQVKRVKIMRK